MKICQLEFDRKLKKNLPLRKKMNPRKRGESGVEGGWITLRLIL